MLISDIIHNHGETFSGEYRLNSPLLHYTKYGNPYITFDLCDMSGSIKSYLWLNCNEEPPGFTDGDRVSVTAQLRFFNGKWIACIKMIDEAKTCTSHPVSLIPARICPLGHLIPRLQELVMSLENMPLHSFLARVFSDDLIAFPFVVVPGSSSHHHNYAGGLLEHSLECAEIVRHIPLFASEVREIGIVSALLHDIGKIRTITSNRSLSRSGFVLNHDDLTLEVLGPYLKGLDEEWPDGGIALRYLLTWKTHRRRPFPLMTIAEAVSAADRISSGVNRETEALSTLPPWRNATKSLYKNGFWRPTPYLETNEKSISRQSMTC